MLTWKLGLIFSALSIIFVLAVSRPVSADPPLQPAQITMPNWLNKPNGDNFISYYPLRAKMLGKEGGVDLNCTVTAAGTLTDCTVVEDTPGYGFGDATLQIAKLFQMKPKTIDGQPVAGGRFRTLIRWRLAPSPTPAAAAGTSETTPSSSAQSTSSGGIAAIRQSKWAASGTAQTLDHFYSLGPDCSSSGNPEVRVLEAPKNGTISVGTGRTFPNYLKDSPRSQCDDKMTDSVTVLYKSNNEYLGDDYTEILVLFPDGTARKYHYEIVIIK